MPPWHHSSRPAAAPGSSRTAARTASRAGRSTSPQAEPDDIPALEHRDPDRRQAVRRTATAEVDARGDVPGRRRRDRWPTATPRRPPACCVNELEHALDRPRHGRVVLRIVALELGAVGLRAAQALDDLIDPLACGEVVARRSPRARRLQASSASATTMPVRSLPAAQWTSAAPSARAISRTAATTESGRLSMYPR